MQHPNLNSHISTLENLIVEGLCPWQGDWILIIFKITSNPNHSKCSEGNLRIFFLSSSLSYLSLHNGAHEPTSLCMKSKRTQLQGANTKLEHLFSTEMKNWRNVCNESGLCQHKAHCNRGQEGDLSFHEGYSSWNEISCSIPLRSPRIQSPNLTDCVSNKVEGV